jgi:hypothetical protein
VSSMCPDAAAQHGREAPVGNPCRAGCGSLKWEAARAARGCADDGSPGGRHRDRRARSRARCAAQAQRRRAVTRHATRVPASRPSPGREMNRRPAPVSPANRIRSLGCANGLRQGLAGRPESNGSESVTPRTAGCAPGEEAPRRSGSAFFGPPPPRTPEKSDEHGGTA